jgi:hypothetical protein
MFRHVVNFRWNSQSSPEHVAALEEALSGLPALLPGLRRYSYGSDAGLNEGNYEFAVVAEFDNADNPESEHRGEKETDPARV